MNPLMQIPATRALLLDAPTGFRIAMIYENADAGRHAKRFSDQLLGKIGEECECVRNLWSFDVLGIKEVRNAAVSAATAADLVIVSVSGERDLFPTAEAWLEVWAWMIDGTNPALVGLFQKRDGRCVRRIQARLRAIAAEKGLEFFTQTTASDEGGAFPAPSASMPDRSFGPTDREPLAGATRRLSHPAECGSTRRSKGRASR